jgi:RNA polymerase sigma-70 factor (ECF subfamily)
VEHPQVIGRSAAAVESDIGELEGQLTDFFAAHYDRLVRLAALICHSGHSTEDAVQAALEHAWRQRHSLRDADRLRPWLDQIVVREAIRTNRKPWWARGPLGTHEEAAAMPDRTAGVNPDWVALMSVFGRLPVEQRATVALHMYAGHSVDETARLMKASVETTRSRLRLAKQRLRRDLGDQP